MNNTLGSDFSGDLDLDPALRIVSGRRALMEAVVRRLTTPRGSLPDWPSIGFDVRSLIGTTLTKSQISQRVLEQCYAEEGVMYAEIDISSSTDGREIEMTIRIRDGEGPFDLTMKIGELGVEAIIPEAA